MAAKCTWIRFQAHPTRFVKSEDNHPDFFGVFVCQASRREPDQLLAELLSNRNLLLVEAGDAELKSTDAPWGVHERLKADMDREGYGLSLTRMHRRAIPVD